MRIEKIISLIILSGLSLMYSMSQNITIRGNVKDNTGSALIGVTIVVINNEGHGTVTDIDGNYTLNNVPTDANLKLSYVGMNDVVEPVNGRAVINVIMTDDSDLLDEVVVVGYGTQKKATVTRKILI